MSQQLREQMRKEGIEVIFRKAIIPHFPGVDYEELKPDTIILPKGTLFSENGIPLPCDIVYESDVAVTMRDGTIIYVDIYRPTNADKVPAIIAWSPYGKKVNNEKRRSMGELGFGSSGLILSKVSGLEKFEGPDPAYWCDHGYAVINSDARGTYNSQGDIYFFGLQEAEDGYDLIEWLVTQDWSNSKVGMAGNSWLATVQWFVAAQRPPHLFAIAPWEGWADFYRDTLAEGGIPKIPQWGYFVEGALGNNRVEDVAAMIAKYPLINSYWREDKAAKLDLIEIPAYVVASWDHIFHTPGTISAFRQIHSKDKWLRVHNTQYLVDQYSQEGEEDLRRFFDRYLKGIQNGWEQTPQVRLSVLDPGGTDEVNRPESEFPLARTQHRKLFLDVREGKLSCDPVAQESAMSYGAEEGKALFTMRLDQTIELSGYMKLRLWIAGVGSNDMDLFVVVQKLDSMGRRLGHDPFRPYMLPNLLSRPRRYYNSGPVGMLRVSHRRLDPIRSTDSEPYLTHDIEEMLSPSQIVPVEVPIRPFSMRWRSGEQLRLSITGFDPMGRFYPNSPLTPTRNKGEHKIYAGGKYDSHLLVPVIPR